MSASKIVLNPKNFFVNLTGKNVAVKLKWGLEYRGILESVDSYMNLRMTNCEEWVEKESKGQIGEVLIRCNNVLYIRDAQEKS